MKKRFLKGITLVRIDASLMQRIYQQPSKMLVIRDKDGLPFYWTVKVEYDTSDFRHIEHLVWEKHRDFDGALMADPEITPIDTTAAVLLHQGSKTLMVKYRPGLRKALDDAGIHCFYNKPPKVVYSDVPSKVEAFFAGVVNPEVCRQVPNKYKHPTKNTKVYKVPYGADLVIQTRYEPNGDITRIVFGSSYIRVKKYLESVLNREVEEFKTTWDAQCQEPLTLKSILKELY